MRHRGSETGSYLANFGGGLRWLGTFAATVLFASVGCGGAMDEPAEQEDPGDAAAQKFINDIEPHIDYELHHYGNGKIAPDEPQLRLGIQIIRLSQAEKEAMVEIEDRQKKKATVLVHGDVAEKFNKEKFGKRDIFAAPKINYQVKSVDHLEEDRKRLHLRAYGPYEVLWGNWDKTAKLPIGKAKRHYERTGKPYIYDRKRIWGESEGDAPPVRATHPNPGVDRDLTEKPDPPYRTKGQSIDYDMPSDGEPKYEPFFSETFGLPALTTCTNVKGSTSACSTLEIHEGKLELGVTYLAEFTFTGEIFFNMQSGIGKIADLVPYIDSSYTAVDKVWSDGQDTHYSGGCTVGNSTIGIDKNIPLLIGHIDLFEAGFCHHESQVKFRMDPTLIKNLDMTVGGAVEYEIRSWTPIDTMLGEFPVGSTGVSVDIDLALTAYITAFMDGSFSFAYESEFAVPIILGFHCKPSGCTFYPNPEDYPGITSDINFTKEPEIAEIGGGVTGAVEPHLKLGVKPTGIPRWFVSWDAFAFGWNFSITGQYRVGPERGPGGPKQKPCLELLFQSGPYIDAGLTLRLFGGKISEPLTPTTRWSIDFARFDARIWGKRGVCPNADYEDSDDDGLLDVTENNDCDSDPNDPDTDGDGLGDEEECNGPTDPDDEDTDDDDLDDPEEIEEGCDPTKSDTDGDGVPDAVEVAEGFDCADPTSFPMPFLIEASWDTKASVDLAVLTPTGERTLSDGSTETLPKEWIGAFDAGPEGGWIESDCVARQTCSSGQSEFKETVHWVGRRSGNNLQPRQGTYAIYAVYENEREQPTPLPEPDVTVKAWKAYTKANASSSNRILNVTRTLRPDMESDIDGTLPDRSDRGIVKLIGTVDPSP